MPNPQSPRMFRDKRGSPPIPRPSLDNSASGIHSMFSQLGGEGAALNHIQIPEGNTILTTKSPLNGHKSVQKLPIVLQAGCGGLVLACNAVMWTFFAKALKYSSSSATATVTSTASNFISSAVLGYLLFGETHALLWWVGISITLFGLLLLHTAPATSEEQRHPKENKI